MDVRDLNILDWVLWDNTPCQVTAIGCDYIETTKCGITLAESHLLNFIPLTEEILEKNFPYLDDPVEWIQYSDKSIYVRIEPLKGVNCDGVLKYVHELQHALKLCGIDKEIEI